MAKVLIVDPDKCTSCRLCELACSERHVGAFRPSHARIRVGILSDEAVYFPMVCIQCDDAHCIAVCPRQALEQDPDTKVVRVVESRCDACGACGIACPYRAIRCPDGIAEKCDLCGGNPACVPFCVPQALRYEPREQWDAAARRDYVRRFDGVLEELEG